MQIYLNKKKLFYSAFSEISKVKEQKFKVLINELIIILPAYVKKCPDKIQCGAISLNANASRKMIILCKTCKQMIYE